MALQVERYKGLCLLDAAIAAAPHDSLLIVIPCAAVAAVPHDSVTHSLSPVH